MFPRSSSTTTRSTRRCSSPTSARSAWTRRSTTSTSTATSASSVRSAGPAPSWSAIPNTGRLERRRIATVRWSFDERIEDGLYAGYGIKHVKKLIEDPVKGGIAIGDDATLAALGAVELDLTGSPATRSPSTTRDPRSRRAVSARRRSPLRTTSRRPPARRCSPGAATRSTRSSRANLALGVVAPYYCGYGGDLFAIVWDGELHGYLGSGRSPAAATHRPRCATRSARRRC